MEKIGIYCGVFNPPHLGHLSAARAACAELGLDRVLLIPDRLPPHKTMPANSAGWAQRMAMLRLAAGGTLQVPELGLSADSPSYTWLTVEKVRRLYPQAQLFLLLGPDVFPRVPNWKGADRFLPEVTLTLLSRGRPAPEALENLEAQGCRVAVVRAPTVDISSTQLRRLLAFGCGWEFLPEGVGDYIRANGLYDTTANWKKLPQRELEKVVTGLLHPNRVAHVLGCRDTAVALARRWGVDETDAARAGLLHDVTKALDGPLQLTLCAAYGKILSDFSRKYPKTLHALTGSMVAERIFGENKPVVAAICHHTTGKADMSTLEKIIYVADYMEPNRTMPGVDRLRQLAYTDLTAALKLGLEMTLQHLNRLGDEVSPESREALAFLNTQSQ